MGMPVLTISVQKITNRHQAYKRGCIKKVQVRHVYKTVKDNQCDFQHRQWDIVNGDMVTLMQLQTNDH